MASILTTKEVVVFLKTKLPDQSVSFERKLGPGLYSQVTLRFSSSKQRFTIETIDNSPVGYTVSELRFLCMYPPDIPFCWVVDGYDAYFPCADDPEPDYFEEGHATNSVY